MTESSGLDVANRIERFLSLFYSVRQKCGAPTRVRWLAENHPAILHLLVETHDAEQSLSRALDRHSVKYLIGTPRDFLGALQDWNARWAPIVSQATAKERNTRTQELIDEIKKAYEAGVLTDELFDEYYRKSNPYDPFDPAKDDASQCIEHSLLTALDLADANSDLILDGENPIFDKCEKGLGAWRYLEAVVGIKLGEAVRRWTELDVVAIPKHVSDSHDFAEPASIYALLREAHVVFAMGNNMAATALCRAILERILVRNYGCDAERLKDVISIAEQRYPSIRQLQLDRLRTRANETLHPKTGRGAPSNEDVARFLRDLKILIERAPSQQTRE